jgi:hypothetical protein
LGLPLAKSLIEGWIHSRSTTSRKTGIPKREESLPF